jgi:hypothetical protein
LQPGCLLPRRLLVPGIQWQQSYFTDDKVFCIYIAESEAQVREHAMRGGFPVDAVRPVSAIVDPVCAD